MYNISML